eukprot:601739-Ditylum_brightwellii.AAC.1
MATEELVPKFDYKEGLLYLFVEEVRMKAKMAGWMDPLSNCITIQVECATYSVLTEYGRLSMEDIIKHTSFKFMSHNRCCQNNIQFYYYLLNSIDKNSKMQILQEDRDLYVQGMPIGAALFKLLMSKTVVDMVVTTSKCRINLQNLDTYMVSANSSIPNFNRHVKNNITGLKSRGEKSDDLI